MNLDWQVIAQKDDELEGEQNRNEGSDIDALVQEIREKVKPKIQVRCGTMRVLDMSQPIELTGERGIYTNVNILEKITGRRRDKITELRQNWEPEDFDRFGLSRMSQRRVPGLEALHRYSKLMVFGKPGAGKTTFLKYLAMHCIEGQENRVPLFITLREFAEEPQQPEMLEYITQQLSDWGVPNANNTAEQLLREGRALVLLDGLDEVREEHTDRIFKQIQKISELFHTNQFVITCRIAANEYMFEQFADVEMADFDETQIATFPENWFRLDPVQAERFIQQLQENLPIQELATNPLLLTLLCLVFEETADLPAKRSDLYKEGLEVLLEIWDNKRNLKRDQVYKNLSLPHKESLLRQIAITTFEQNNYFFTQEFIEEDIAKILANLDDLYTEKKELKLHSKSVLKSIEAQHGLLVKRAKDIYSFSHLTFQEYFVAKEIALESLVQHITEKRWREVFLLAAEMLPNADQLLQEMKITIDALVAHDENLQNFLKWVSQKSASVVRFTSEQAAIRAFYFALELDFGFDLALAFDFDLASIFALAFDFGLASIPADNFDFESTRQFLPNLVSAFELALELSRVLSSPRREPAQVRGIVRQIINIDLNGELQQVRSFLSNPIFSSFIPQSFVPVLDRFLRRDFARTLELARELAPILDSGENASNPTRDLAHALELVRAIVLTDDLNLAHALAHDLARAIAFNDSLTLALEFLILNLGEIVPALDDEERDLSSERINKLKELLSQPPRSSKQEFKNWWEKVGTEWTTKLRETIGLTPYQGSGLKFSPQQKELLKQYYDANKLLMDCLKSDCTVSHEIRQKIEDKLLLPMFELHPQPH